MAIAVFTASTLMSLDATSAHASEAGSGAPAPSSERRAYRVEATINHVTRSLVTLATEGGAIEATTDHPVFVIGRGFVPARNVRVGDDLRNARGSVNRVLDARTRMVSPTNVWNLTVAGAHTYFVGHDTVLVHNNQAACAANLSDREAARQWARARMEEAQSNYSAAQGSRRLAERRGAVEKSPGQHGQRSRGYYPPPTPEQEMRTRMYGYLIHQNAREEAISLRSFAKETHPEVANRWAQTSWGEVLAGDPETVSALRQERALREIREINPKLDARAYVAREATTGQIWSQPAIDLFPPEVRIAQLEKEDPEAAAALRVHMTTLEPPARTDIAPQGMLAKLHLDRKKAIAQVRTVDARLADKLAASEADTRFRYWLADDELPFAGEHARALNELAARRPKEAMALRQALAPGDLGKEGPLLDVYGALARISQQRAEELSQIVVLGGKDGQQRVRELKGLLPMRGPDGATRTAVAPDDVVHATFNEMIMRAGFYNRQPVP